MLFREAIGGHRYWVETGIYIPSVIGMVLWRLLYFVLLKKKKEKRDVLLILSLVTNAIFSIGFVIFVVFFKPIILAIMK